MDKKAKPNPLFVSQDGTTWRWVCRVCTRSEWAPRFNDAIKQAHHHHEYSHRTFGFTGDKR